MPAKKTKRPRRKRDTRDVADARLERFAHAIARGIPEIDAYIEIWNPPEGFSRKTAYETASRHKSKMRTRIKDIIASLNADEIMSMQEQLCRHAEMARRCKPGLKGVLTVLPDGSKFIEVDETNADIVKEARVEVQNSGQGEQTEAHTFMTVKVRDSLPYDQEFSKLAGRYPATRLEITDPLKASFDIIKERRRRAGKKN